MNNSPPLGEEFHLPTREVVVERHKEKAIEGLEDMMDKIAKGEDFDPIIIGKQNGEIMATKCEVKDGILFLPEIKVLSPLEILRKKRMVNKIMKEVNPAIISDIETVTSSALMRKTPDQLKNIITNLKKKDRPSLKNRIGCIFLEVGDESVQI